MTTKERPQQGLNAALKKRLVQPFQMSKPKNKQTKVKTVDTSSYHYESLDPNTKSARLLEVIPGPDYEPIKGKIIHCNLEDNPSYIALSYTWDHGGDPKFIECEGTTIKVGQNLWSFLHQYRQKLSNRLYHEQTPPESVPLWIDALCINQQNMDERAHQVGQMRDIYTGASSVIVWLGLAVDTEELAFMLTRYPTLLRADEASGALIRLLNKPYWSRVWVVQEFVLAKTVEIWCGTFHADASAFENLWRHDDLMSNSPAFSQYLVSTQGWPLFKSRREFRHSKKYKRELLGRRDSKSLRSTFRLRDLLQSFATSQSSEVYDKVYGFLGIASKGRADLPIEPDYTKPPVELLIDVLQNQCYTKTRRGEKDDHKFLLFLMRTLKVSRMELAQHILLHAPDVERHIYILTALEFMAVSVSFVSTISDIGAFVEHAEAYQDSTWKSAWKTTFTRSSMHPKSFSSRDVQELRPIALSQESALVLSFADQHIKDALYMGRSEELRQSVIDESTEVIIQSLVTPLASPELDMRVGSHKPMSNAKLRQLFFRSMSHSTQLHVTARHTRHSSESNIRYERYATFTGTNGVIGFACIGGEAGAREIHTGDRVCTFSDSTESSNAFIVRLDQHGNWIIVGFAIILYPAVEDDNNLAAASASPIVSDFPGSLFQRVDTGATVVADEYWDARRRQTLDTDQKMCFHCHLTDLMELSRCGVLSPKQLERLLEQSLRGEEEDEVHRCALGMGQSDVLEFGLLS